MERNCFKSLVLLLCLFALPAKAETVQFGWYVGGALTLDGSTFNFLRVTFPDFNPKLEDLSMSGVIGLQNDLTGIPISAACFGSYSNGHRVYRCDFSTRLGMLTALILRDGEEAGDGWIAALDEHGKVVAGSEKALVLAHRKAID